MTLAEMKEQMVFRVVIDIEPDEDGYHAYCSCMKGLHVWGKTEKEAKALVRDAVLAYIESLVKHHEPIPLCPVERSQPKPSARRSIEDLALVGA